MSQTNFNTLGELFPTTQIWIAVVAAIVSVFNPWTSTFASADDHAGCVGRHQSKVLLRDLSSSALRFEANQGQTEDRVQFWGAVQDTTSSFYLIKSSSGFTPRTPISP
jgi:hypothetical protein